MVIARMLLRGGLLTLAFTSAIAAAIAICRTMRTPSLRDAEPQRTRTERVRSPSASKSRRQPDPRRSSERRRA
jgi:hypothetical protein